MLSVFRNLLRKKIMQLEINSQIEQSLKVIAISRSHAPRGNAVATRRVA
jgi:hypothetical protein